MSIPNRNCLQLSSELEQLAANESQRIKAVDICDKIYENLIKKLGEVDQERSAYNNNTIS